MPFRRSNRLIGLDIGSSAIKAIELKRGWRGLRVAALGLQPVPRNSVVDGRIADANAVTDAVRVALGPRFSARDVATSLGGNSVSVKRITLPHPRPGEPAPSIEAEIDRHLPLGPRDVNVDYIIADRGDKARGTDIEVLVVAAKKAHVDGCTAVVAGAGRSAAVVDVDAFALHNAYQANYGSGRGTTVALLDAGATAIRLNVLTGERAIFTRDVSPGGNAISEAVQKELNVPFDVAERLKTGLHDDPSLRNEANAIVRAMTERAVQDIAKAFHHLKTSGTDRIDRIVLTGGGSLLEGFLALVRERFEAEVDWFNPFRRVAFGNRRGGTSADALAPVMGVAVGLALRRGGEW